MQRHTPDGVIIACDFTGLDWDEVIPMIEGHRGSVLSLAALAMAIEQRAAADAPFDCTLCLRHFEPPEVMWRHPKPPAHANPDALICEDCIRQADRTFARDPEVDWTRKLQPTQRWR